MLQKGERRYLNEVALAITARFSGVPLFSSRLLYKLDQISSVIERKKEN